MQRSLAGRKLIIGVDRLDYTKGLPQRLLAFERLHNDEGQTLSKLLLDAVIEVEIRRPILPAIEPMPLADLERPRVEPVALGPAATTPPVEPTGDPRS